jgi:hypothetical protein
MPQRMSRRRFGIGLGEGFDPPGDLGEEVTGFELEEVVVDPCHGRVDA